MRATHAVPFNPKGYQFDAHLWNKEVDQFIFNYVVINDIHLREDTDDINAALRTGPRATHAAAGTTLVRDWEYNISRWLK